jgi:hypothetical protein
MNDTRDKLQEMIYFLEQMKTTVTDPSTFRFTLSAFLSAARSVTLMMQKEYNAVTGFGEWYTKQQLRMNNDNDMKLFNEKRVMAIHKKSVQPHSVVDVTMNAEIPFTESIVAISTQPDGTIGTRQKITASPAPPTKESAKAEWKWYFEERNDKDVITLSKEHTSKLNSIVEECEALFKTESRTYR